MAKTFTRLGKQIAIAVKAGGPEPENNPALRSVIATCKRENMPKDNIERAIKNAMGKDQSDYKEVTYEGYGPHGIAVFVDTLTDNTTRTVGDVRSVFNKFSGTLGTTGSLAYLFDHKCVFTFKKKDGIDMDDLVLELIDLNVEDEFDEDTEEGTITIYGDPKSYGAIQKHLEEQGFSGTVVGDAEDDALVTVQVPSPGASIPKEGMVALYTEEPDPETYVEVPSFIGYDIDTCRYLAGLADVQVLVVGDGDSGYAQSQDIAEGTKVKRGSVIRISFVSSGGVEAAGNTSTNSEE